MTPETEKKLEKVRKYSASLRSLFRFFSVIVVIAMIIGTVFLLTTSSEDTTFALLDMRFTGAELTPTIRVLAGIHLAIVFAILIKLLHHLAALFGLYAEGMIFTADNVAQIRQIGISVFLFCASWIYVIVARLVLFTMRHPIPPYVPREDTIGFTADSLPLFSLIAGIIIIVISWIMDVGRELREEQDLTV